MFEPLTADLSAAGQSVVFDSIIAANEYDASVPLANDQATYRPPQSGAGTPAWQNPQNGTVDVFVWRAPLTPIARSTCSPTTSIRARICS